MNYHKHLQTTLTLAWVICLIFTTPSHVKSQLEVKKIEWLKHIQTGYSAKFSPGSDAVIYTGENLKGLFYYSFDQKTIRTITESEGAGFEPQLSENGKNVVYKSFITNEKGKRSSNCIVAELATGKIGFFTPYHSHLSIAGLKGNRLVYSENSELQVLNLDTKEKSTSDEKVTIAFSDENLNLILIQNGKMTILNPQGKAHYIWVSISPQEDKILYTIPGKGSFICNLEGNILFQTGKLNAPKWFSNGEFVIGMDDKDNGQNITSSEIVLFSLNEKKRTILTEKTGIIALNPDISPDGKKIVFNDEKGKIYLIHL